MRRTARAQAGYNLVEVIIALAVFGIVAITIFTLFVMGRRNIYSGKQASQAVAIGTQVLEDLAPLNKKMIYNGAFGILDTDTGAAVTLPRVSGKAAPTFTNAKIRSTDANIIASPPADISTNPTGMLTRWSGLLANKLTNPSVTVVLIPSQDPTNSPEQFGTSQLLRVRVFVRWTETGHRREVVLDTVKAY
ncbi:MAG TPA: prepilin-type N-terminal cleavage/methylation domain-containing protein [Thermoanaerobaculia bacterium]|nr:prepilin-type N-terminal cleavage/methylation domain-containing protein [Thermoanaerobaculia bacterium]